MIECEKLDEYLRDHAVALVNSVWHGIDWRNVGSRRRMRIYEEFTNKIRSAAHAGRISVFYDALCRKMDSNPTGMWGDDALKTIQSIEAHKLDLDALELIISDTQYIVLLMRDINEKYKQEDIDKEQAEL